MGGRLDLPSTCTGKPPEGGAQRVPGWLFMTPTERSKIHNRRQDHGMLTLPTLKEVCMGWCLKRGGIRLGG